MKYKIRAWIFRIRRAFNWAWFIYKQPRWQEYDNLSEIIQKQLLEMEKEFREKDITVSSQYHSKRMKLAAELLKRGTAKYYEEQYREKYWIEDMSPYKKDNIFSGSGYHPSHNFKDSGKAARKDDKAIELAFKIMARDFRRWWQ